MTTLPPTYIRECKSSPSPSADFARAMTRAVQSSCSSARSKRATMLKTAQLANARRSEVGGNLPLSEIHLLGVFPVNVQGLGLLGKIKDNTVEYGAQVW